MKLAFLFPPAALGSRTIDWTDPEKVGLTGTDQVCIKLAEHMAKRGHDVDIFVERVPNGGRFWNDVAVREWGLWEKFASATDYNAVIATSHPVPLKLANPSALRVVNRQVSVFVPGDDWQADLEDVVDLYLCPSNAAREVVSKGMRHPERFRVLHNGHTPPSGPQPPKEPGRCVYISSPDRGLELVLSEWGRIRQAIPWATLKIFYYSLRSWIEKNTKPELVARLERRELSIVDAESVNRAIYVANALEKHRNHGVEAVGGVSHEQMQTELAQAEVLTYPLSPLAFTETFGCAVLEACAHGVVPVISDADAFGELWGEVCPHVDLPRDKYPTRWTEDQRSDWRKLVIRTLTDDAFRAEQAAAVRQHATKFTWEGQAAKLEAILEQGIEAKRSAPQVTSVTSAARPKLSMVLTQYAQGEEKIDPKRPFDRATGGGAPTEFMGLVQQMPALGYDVRVYADFTHHPSTEGLAYRTRFDLRTDETPDVMLAFYDTRPLLPSKAKVRVACHLTFQLPFPTEIVDFTLNTAPSDYARQKLEPVYGGRWATLPNSVNPDLPQWSLVPGRVISHISVDRGLHHTLRAWPLVRERMPGATLHVVGGVEEWVLAAKMQSTVNGKWARQLSDAIPAAIDAGGVDFLGRLPRKALLHELSEGACFVFPCDTFIPCETFSRSTMECLWMGMPCVLSAADAMESIYGDYALFVKKTPEAVADGIVRALGGALAHLRERGRALARAHTFEANARVLDKAIREVMQ